MSSARLVPKPLFHAQNMHMEANPSISKALLEEYIGIPINFELILPRSVLSKMFSCCGQVFAETISVTKTSIKFKELKGDMRERVATDRQLEYLKQKIVSSLFEYHIMQTCPCDVDPITPHYYIVKLGFTGVYIIFLFLL